MLQSLASTLSIGVVCRVLLCTDWREDEDEHVWAGNTRRTGRSATTRGREATTTNRFQKHSRYFQTNALATLLYGLQWNIPYRVQFIYVSSARYTLATKLNSTRSTLLNETKSTVTDTFNFVADTVDFVAGVYRAFHSVQYYNNLSGVTYTGCH